MRRTPPQSPPNDDELRVLVLPATAADGVAIGKLLDSVGMKCLLVRNVAAVCDAMRDGAGVLVIAEETLAPGYQGLVECIRVQAVWSDLPVLLLSSSARSESATLAEIVPLLGNVSVVERPVRMSTLVSLVRSSLPHAAVNTKSAHTSRSRSKRRRRYARPRSAFDCSSTTSRTTPSS